MTDTQALPPPESEPAAGPATVEPAPLEPAVAGPVPRRGFALGPILGLIGFLILAGGLFYVWRNPVVPPQQPGVAPAEFEQLRQQVAAIGQQVTAMGQRVGRLEQRPTPAPTDLKPFEERLTALEQRPQGEASAAVDLKPIEDRLAALEKQNGDIERRAADLERKIVPDVATRADLGNLATRVDAVATREDQLAARQQGLETGFANRMDRLEAQIGSLTSQSQLLLKLPDQLQTVEKRLGVTEKEASQVSSLADRASRIARIQAAQSALDSGQPIGILPNAPPALARFADKAPPTQSELLLSFNQAANAAEQASVPDTDTSKPLLDRLWMRAQTAVMLREGDRVIFGNPAGGVIARAREALLAGDLRGAVQALNDLSGPGAKAMADWKGRAQALLDARAALATMAANA